MGDCTGKRVQCCFASDNVLDGRGTTMGMDPDILGHISKFKHGGYPSIWRDRVLAVTVSPSSSVKYLVPGVRLQDG